MTARLPSFQAADTASAAQPHGPLAVRLQREDPYLRRTRHGQRSVRFDQALAIAEPLTVLTYGDETLVFGQQRIGRGDGLAGLDSVEPAEDKVSDLRAVDHAPPPSLSGVPTLNRRSRRELVSTLTEESAMATAANIGSSRIPKTG